MIFLTYLNSTLNWLEQHLLACPFKSFSGMDCPGCGIQRSLLLLFQGDLAMSFKLYPATIPILILFVFTGFHLKFDFKNGAFFVKLLYIGVTLIIVTHYVYKIYTHQLI
jgi:hypothetical protein